MFFSGWDHLLRILVLGVLTYIGLVTLLRVSGKRTLASMNAFDFIVTVAFGSTLASTILPSQVTLVDGLLALGLLILLQYAVAWLEIRFPFFHRIVTSHPTILFYQGQFLKEKMRHERLEEGDILAVIRKQGVFNLDDVEAVVLETDGSCSVLTRPDRPVERSSIRNISPLTQIEREEVKK